MLDSFSFTSRHSAVPEPEPHSCRAGPVTWPTLPAPSRFILERLSSLRFIAIWSADCMSLSVNPVLFHPSPCSLTFGVASFVLTSLTAGLAFVHSLQNHAGYPRPVASLDEPLGHFVDIQWPSPKSPGFRVESIASIGQSYLNFSYLEHLSLQNLMWCRSIGI